MQKVSKYKCPVCHEKYSSLKTWANHMDTKHSNVIPSNMTHSQYYYFLLTGKSKGTCIVCKSDTKWNETTQKYERFCSNPKCKDRYREQFKSRMINKYGKVHLLNDPNQQRKMLASKKNAGTYKFADGKEVEYYGTYELDFLKMLDVLLKFNSNDIMSPSPHTYYYDYKNPNDIENEGCKFYIPDFYIPSANLEIEIKQSTNTHPKLARIDKVKELQKDDLMHNLKGVNYFKVVDKDYTAFFKYLEKFDKIASSEAVLEAVNKYEIPSINSGKLKLRDYKINMFDGFDIDEVRKSNTVLNYHISKLIKNDSSKAFLMGDIIYDGKSPIAYFIVRKNPEKSNIVWLEHIYVAKEVRRNTLGSQLLTRAIRKYGVTNVCVDVNDSAVIEMFLKQGFSEYLRDLSNIFLAL